MRNRLKRLLETCAELELPIMAHANQWPDWPGYGDHMLEIFKQFDPSGASIPRIFGGNALECYGLSENRLTSNRVRLEKLFKARTGAVPGWMQPPGTSSSPG